MYNLVKENSNYLNNKLIIPSSPDEIETFLLPILIDTDLDEIYYLNQNIFLKKLEY